MRDETRLTTIAVERDRIRKRNRVGGFGWTAVVFVHAAFFALALPARGAWNTQTLTLQPGWNAVFLEVQPVPDAIDKVFEGLPVRSVWMWNRKFSPVQFVQDVFEFDSADPPKDWLAWYAAEQGDRFRTLHTVRGGRAYLIRIEGSEPVTWNVTGHARVSDPEWVADSYNLMGFFVDPARPPTFKAVLDASPAHAAADAYRLDTAGHWVHIDAPETELVQPGTAYWIYCKGPSTYPGPMKVTLEQGGEVNFGKTVTEQVVRVRNEGKSARVVSMQPKPDGEPPAGEPSSPGDVPLSYFNGDTLEWVSFPPNLDRQVAPGEELSLRVAVRRPDMTGGSADAPNRGLLEINNGAGTRISASVSAYPGSVLNRSGLWVGTATINQVSHAGADTPEGREAPVPTSSDMGIRLILHVDQAGQVRLLQHVTLMWKDGTYKADPNEPTKQIVDEPGREVLVANDALLPQFKGAALRDGQQVGRRISSAAFGFDQPVLMSDEGGALRSGDMVMAYDDPRNPFFHKYHPDHDNLDWNFTPIPTPQADGAESFTIRRSITLTLTPGDPQGLQVAGWGDTRLGGNYAETIRGLHREAIYVAGFFRLQHVSRVDVLDDGL